MESFFEAIPILPKAVLLSCPDSMGISRIRGFWGGNGIMPLDPESFAAVFRPLDADGKPAPGYVIAEAGRPAPGVRLVHWTLVGEEAVARDEILTQAWAVAGQPRDDGAPPFVPREMRVRCPGGTILPRQFSATAWPLADARWPLPGDPATTPCVIDIPGGLHLTGQDKRFQSVIEFEDIILAACRRVARCLPEELRAPFRPLRTELLERAELCPATLRLRKVTVEIMAGRSRAPKKYFALAGRVELRKGPGSLWPLLLAAHWLQIGSHFAEGLGHIVIRKFESAPSTAKPRENGGRKNG